MPTKDNASSNTQSKKHQSGHRKTRPHWALSLVNKFLDNWSLKHLNKLMNKRDVPEVICLLIVGYIFVKILPYAIKQPDTLWNIPFWLIATALFLIVILVVIFIYYRRNKK